MSDLINVRIRLHLPEGKIGDVIAVSTERAEALVNGRYATYADEDETPVAIISEGPAPVAPAPGPQVDLPAVSDVKQKWIDVAESLGIDTEGMNKTEVVDAVTEAVG